MRPSTLREVSDRIVDGADPVKVFSEFLDHFYDRTTELQMLACLEEEPILLGSQSLNALYAAAADYLCKRYRLGTIPRWTMGPHRFLREPWFSSHDIGMHEYLTFTSPAEFLSRNIFTEAAPLRRARTWQAEQRLEQRLVAAKKPGMPAPIPDVETVVGR